MATVPGSPSCSKISRADLGQQIPEGEAGLQPGDLEGSVAFGEPLDHTRTGTGPGEEGKLATIGARVLVVKRIWRRAEFGKMLEEVESVGRVVDQILGALDKAVAVVPGPHDLEQFPGGRFEVPLPGDVLQSTAHLLIPESAEGGDGPYVTPLR